MLETKDILETINMIDNENLDVRTITMGISLLDCLDEDIERACAKVYDKIMRSAKDLVRTGEDIEREYGIPIINKRISVTPIGMVAAPCQSRNVVRFAHALDKAAKELGVNFIGGYSALVHKGFASGDYALIESIPQALSETDFVCSSVNIGSTKAGINMDAVKMMGKIVKQTAELTADRNCIGAAKLVVFCNAPEDNPFMAGAFHGVGESDTVINVGVSGPGVVRAALAKGGAGKDITEIADMVKKTAFKITRMGQLVAKEASKRLCVPFGIVDLSLAPTPAVGDSVAYILEEMGLEVCGCHGTTAALALLNDAVKKGGVSAAQRRGEKGRRDGVQPCGRTQRRVYSRIGGRRHDCRRNKRSSGHHQAGEHDGCLLCGTGYDRGARRHHRRNHLRHHRGRSRHRHGQHQNHGGAPDSRYRQTGGRRA